MPDLEADTCQFCGLGGAGTYVCSLGHILPGENSPQQAAAASTSAQSEGLSSEECHKIVEHLTESFQPCLKQARLDMNLLLAYFCGWVHWLIASAGVRC